MGKKSLENIEKMISKSRRIFWNGPVGLFENEAFASGTKFILDCLCKATAEGSITILGGGDSAFAARKFHCEDKISHISTGGGASLELIQGYELPGISALNDS